VSSVRCLGCGAVYDKPERGGMAAANPGCPRCGYVGWILDEDGLKEELERLRSVEDPQQDRSRQSS
jgi:predicted  nucleic acid-binding Zn-ribbon protein